MASGPPLRILLINNDYPPHVRGGYGQLARDVVERLRYRGHELYALTSDIGLDRRTAESHANQTSAEFRVARRLRLSPAYGARLNPAIQFFLHRKAAETHNRHALRQVVANFQPDICFFWNLQYLPSSLALDMEASDVAVAYWLAGYTPGETHMWQRYWALTPKRPLLGWPKRFLTPFALRQMQNAGWPQKPAMKNVAVVSQYMRDKGLAEDTLPLQTQIIYNGVEFESFYGPPRQPSKNLTILQAGRVSDDKGVHTAIEATALLTQNIGRSRVQLLIAGDGPIAYRRRLENLAETLDIRSSIQFLGWQAREAMPALMHSADILLLPTTHDEPFARVVLEGMAAGLAVISSLTGGTGEIVRHGETGLTFQAGNAIDLAQQLAILAEEPATRQRLALAGQGMVRDHFTLDKMVERLEQFLVQALASQEVG